MEMLEKYGAVSEPVARAMAQGAAEQMRTDLAVSATGLAGPDGDGSGTLVGTVYLGLYMDGKVMCRCYLFDGERAEIQGKAVESALEFVLCMLEK